MPKDPKSKKVSKAKAAKNTVDVEIAAEVVDDSKPKLKKGKKPKKTYNSALRAKATLSIDGVVFFVRSRIQIV